MDLYIQVNGGCGKNLSLTGVLKEQSKYENVYVCSPYFDIFESCPAVAGVYKPQEIRDFIFDAKESNAKLVIDNMYQTQDFIYKKISYEAAWKEMLELEDYKEGPSNTKVFVDPAARYPQLLNQVKQVKEAVKNAGFTEYVIMQFTGGQSPLVQVPLSVRKDKEGKDEQFADWSKVTYNYDNEPLKRHYPKEKAQQFVDLFMKEHPKTAIIMYQLPNEPCPTGKSIVRTSIPYLAYYELAKEATGIVTIDSSLQHLTAGMAKTVVIWGHSLPESFGYSYNKNVIQDCRRDDILYFTQLGPSGARIKYIDPEELLKKVDDYLYDHRKVNA